MSVGALSSIQRPLKHNFFLSIRDSVLHRQIRPSRPIRYLCHHTFRFTEFGRTMPSLLQPLFGETKGSPGTETVSTFLEGEKSTDETIQRLNELAISARISGPEKLESYLWDLWYAILCFAASTPHELRTDLVTLLQSLQSSSSPTSESGDQLSIDHGAVWKDMPMYSIVKREFWNYCL